MTIHMNIGISVKIVDQNFTDGGFGVCVAINSLLSFGAVSDKKS